MANENDGRMRSRTWSSADRQSILDQIEESLLFTPSDYTVTVSSLGPEGGFTVTETWRDISAAERRGFAAACRRAGNNG